jgi:membrane protein YdbS with pleckstrin-like domain
MEEKFKPILEEDEQIVETITLNKTKFFWSVFLASFFILSVVNVFVILGVCMEFGFIWALVPAGVMVLCIFIVMMLAKVYYKNCIYAITNKKIIIRSGIFGVDFHSLDLESVSAINVKVSLLDKLLKKNTGTIEFGSMSSPIIRTSDGVGAGYKFNNIEDPYEVYKRIKKYVEESKTKG